MSYKGKIEFNVSNPPNKKVVVSENKEVAAVTFFYLKPLFDGQNTFREMKVKMMSLCMMLVCFSACTKDDAITLQATEDNEMFQHMEMEKAMMDTMMMTNDPEIDFARLVIMHNESSLPMIDLELEKGKDATMLAMAPMVRQVEVADIAFFENILATRTVDNTVADFGAELKENGMHMYQDAKVQFLTGDTDNDWATLMAVHHEGGNHQRAHLPQTQYGRRSAQQGDAND